MFIEKPVNKVSLSLRKLVSGIGVNDASYIVQPSTNGVVLMCPFYRIWKAILLRCYTSTNKKDPTYVDCYVCDEWIKFSNFKLWMEKQDWIGKEIDKDILIQGNKVYSPDTCLFVSKRINALVTIKKGREGKYKQGVIKLYNKFYARCNIDGIQIPIGSFYTEGEAFAAYKEVKYKHIKEVAEKQSEPLRSALLKYKIDGDSK